MQRSSSFSQVKSKVAGNMRSQKHAKKRASRASLIQEDLEQHLLEYRGDSTRNSRLKGLATVIEAIRTPALRTSVEGDVLAGEADCHEEAGDFGHMTTHIVDQRRAEQDYRMPKNKPNTRIIEIKAKIATRK